MTPVNDILKSSVRSNGFFTSKTSPLVCAVELNRSPDRRRTGAFLLEKKMGYKDKNKTAAYSRIYYKEHKKELNIESKKYYYWYKEKYPWRLTLAKIKTRCTNPKCKEYKWYGGRGIKPLITKDELKQLWFRDKAWLLKQPSIDRINNEGNYTFENCRFIEVSENSKKKIIKYKAVNQYSLGGKFIKSWGRIKEIETTLGFANSNISLACSGKVEQRYGFIWKFKEGDERG